MAWGVRGRITSEPVSDQVTLTVDTSGRLLRWSFGIIGAVTQAAFFGGVLLGIAGTADWPRAWVCIAIWAVNTVVVCVVSSTEIVIERSWPVRDLHRMPRADGLLLCALAPVIASWLVLMPLDRFHLELTDRPPVALSAAGLPLVAVGCAFITLATRQNRFASPVVKLQDNQSVVDDGVYRIVRHPMYLGAALLVVGLPLWLESYLAVAVGLKFVVGLAVRIAIEERVLGDLDGYRAYRDRGRHRLIPHVW